MLTIAEYIKNKTCFICNQKLKHNFDLQCDDHFAVYFYGKEDFSFRLQIDNFNIVRFSDGKIAINNKLNTKLFDILNCTKENIIKKLQLFLTFY
jgi:hypothetical protein